MNNNQNSPLFLIVTMLSFIFFSCNNGGDKSLQLKKNSLVDNIGDTFRLQNIIDISGNQVQLDFSKTEFTVIDFWFNSCPPCVEEMKQFSEVLAGKETKISIISISINQFWIWKPTMTNPPERFSFLKNTSPSWTQYALKSFEDENLKNEISTDREKEIQGLYNITFFPAYFVVDKNGIIIQRPVSAVQFIRDYK